MVHFQYQGIIAEYLEDIKHQKKIVAVEVKIVVY